MARIAPAEKPNEKSQKMLDDVKKNLGKVPNIFQTFAHSPAVLEFYLNGSGALKNTAISAPLREQIALTVAGVNQCDYCASAHTAIGKGQKLDDAALADALKGKASDTKEQAALSFAKKLVESQGRVTDADLSAVTKAGYSEAEALEIVAVVAFNIFTNYFNHVADTDVDFPPVSTGANAKAA